MNLINLFHSTIAEIGIKTIENPVFYQAALGIRFEIGGEEDVYVRKVITRKLQPNPAYVNEAVERALVILSDLPENDWLLRIDLYDEKEIKKIVKELHLVPSHEKVLNEYSKDGDKVTHYELYWSLNDMDWSKETIIRNIILADIGGLNCLASAVYLLHTDEKILFHLYDDRGLDLVSNDKKKLYPFYKAYNDWILEYDRERIDKIFENEQETFELESLLDFLNKLEKEKIFYQLNKIREEAIMVEVVVPGQRWELEFLNDGTVDVEKFLSDQKFYGESELEVLFEEFSD